MTKRCRFTADFKAKVALDALCGDLRCKRSRRDIRCIGTRWALGSVRRWIAWALYLPMAPANTSFQNIRYLGGEIALGLDALGNRTQSREFVGH